MSWWLFLTYFTQCLLDEYTPCPPALDWLSWEKLLLPGMVEEGEEQKHSTGRVCLLGKGSSSLSAPRSTKENSRSCSLDLAKINKVDANDGTAFYPSTQEAERGHV